LSLSSAGKGVADDRFDVAAAAKDQRPEAGISDMFYGDSWTKQATIRVTSLYVVPVLVPQRSMSTLSR